MHLRTPPERALRTGATMRRALLVMVTLGPLGLAGCSSVGSGAAAPAIPAAPAQAPAPEMPTGAALGGALGGPVGASLAEDDRAAAWEAQVAALDSGQRRSWRGSQGVFGFIEPGASAGDGCRAYSQTIYIAGRPNRGHGVGCKQPDGSWKMTS
jgi:surface antigen